MIEMVISVAFSPNVIKRGARTFTLTIFAEQFLFLSYFCCGGGGGFKGAGI
jgi:hypothetical protein